jgi:hypothetical protein
MTLFGTQGVAALLHQDKATLVDLVQRLLMVELDMVEVEVVEVKQVVQEIIILETVETA